MQNLIFGTDGIRGIANKQVSANLVFFIGKSLAVKILQNKKAKKMIIIGKDTRVSGDMLYCALSAGLLCMGVNVVNVGLCTTPALSYLTKLKNYDYGIMITASHNPAEYNGIKIFNSYGTKVMPSFELELQQILNNIDTYLPTQQIGCVYNKPELLYCYTEHIINSVNLTDLQNCKVAIDCANGAGANIIPYICKTLLNDCSYYNCSTDGVSINKDCGSINTQKFISIIKDKYDIGFAFDGDADRVVVVLKNGEVLTGEVLLYVLAKYYKQNNILKNNSIVTTVLTNTGVLSSLQKINVTSYIVDVGDKYIMHKMQKTGTNLGVEDSGHIILNDIVPSADGLLAGLIILKIFKNINFDIPKYIAQLHLYSSIKENIKVTERQKALFNKGVLKQYIYALENELGGCGRLLVRSSGTECVIRILIEGKDLVVMKDIVEKIKKRILSI